MHLTPWGRHWLPLLLAPVLGACSALVGPRDVPPPWDLPAVSSDPAPAPAVRPPPALGDEAGPRLDAAAVSASPDRPAVYATGGSGRSAIPPRSSSSVPARPRRGSLQIDETPPAFGSPRPVASLPEPVGPAGFVVGVGDTLVITVYGQPDLSATVNVSSDGSVPLALIGKTQVAGLTPTQAAEHISSELKRGQYLLEPQVSVTLSQYQSQQISVLGDVKSPGRFPVSVRLTVLDSLALAGGITELGSPRVYVLRPDPKVDGGVVTRYEIDTEALVAAGVGQEYFNVRAGDTVMVPRAEVFYIYGEVRNPNAYKLRPEMTVMQALSLGGGLTDKGSNSRLQIRRRGADGKLVTQSASLTERVNPDDVIFVRERIF